MNIEVTIHNYLQHVNVQMSAILKPGCDSFRLALHTTPQPDTVKDIFWISETILKLKQTMASENSSIRDTLCWQSWQMLSVQLIPYCS